MPALRYDKFNETKLFEYTDNVNDIVESSYTNTWTCIHKDKNVNTNSLNGYCGVITKLNNEKNGLREEIGNLKAEKNRLQADLAKAIRQKKQFKFVLFLFVILLGAAGCLYSLYGDLTNTKQSLSDANDYIEVQNGEIIKKDGEISVLSDNVDELKNALTSEISKKEAFKFSLDSLQGLHTRMVLRNDSIRKVLSVSTPFVVKYSSFDYDTGFYSFDFYGLVSTEVEVELRAYGDDGTFHKNTRSLFVTKGSHSSMIFLSKELDRSRFYSFELICNKRIIGGSVQ